MHFVCASENFFPLFSAQNYKEVHGGAFYRVVVELFLLLSDGWTTALMLLLWHWQIPDLNFCCGRAATACAFSRNWLRELDHNQEEDFIELRWKKRRK